MWAAPCARREHTVRARHLEPVLAEGGELDRAVHHAQERGSGAGADGGEHAFEKVRAGADGRKASCKPSCSRPFTLVPVSDVFTHHIRVRYGECDPQGVVFNANWLAYYDIVITELWRELIGDYSGMVEQGADMMVAEAGIRFRGPARFDDVVEFQLSVTRLGETALSTRVEARVDGNLAIEGTMRHVFVDPGTNTKRPIPEHIREALRPLLVEEDEPARA